MDGAAKLYGKVFKENGSGNKNAIPNAIPNLPQEPPRKPGVFSFSIPVVMHRFC